MYKLRATHTVGKTDMSGTISNIFVLRLLHTATHNPPVGG